MQARLLLLEEPQHGIHNIGPNDLDRKGQLAGGANQHGSGKAMFGNEHITEACVRGPRCKWALKIAQKRAMSSVAHPLDIRRPS